MGAWQTPIRCYCSPGGGNRNKIADWYADLSKPERADADAFLSNMRKMKDWQMPHYRPHLKGLKGIGELRWFSQDKQHRLLGFFREGVWYALVGCTHKQKIYDPPDAFRTAKKNKEQIETREATTTEYDL
ncbi:MAG: hypothetical protein EXQ52_02800 [Bryobacterales bacterium]|nr:hypothetical protein [Bryobacterales bacterium]